MARVYYSRDWVPPLLPALPSPFLSGANAGLLGTQSLGEKGPILYRGGARCLVRMSRFPCAVSLHSRASLLFRTGTCPPKPNGSSGPCLGFLCFELNVELTSCFFHPAHTVHLWINLLVLRTTQVKKGTLQITFLPSDFTLTALQGNKVASSLMAGRAHWWPERSHTFTVPFLIHKESTVLREPNDFSMCLVFLVLSTVFSALQHVFKKDPVAPY